MLISGKVIRFASVFAVLSFLVSGLVLNFNNSESVLAQEGNPNRNPIRICHTTAAHTNPYTSNTVDQDSVDGYSGNDNGQGDHYLTHQGPIWFSGITEDWGDIIPPVPASGDNPGHGGLNWNSNGQAIWNNACNIPGQATPDPSATPTPTATPNNDICLNIDGIQTSVPADLHIDASGLNCVAFQLGGPSDSGTGGQVLGASTTGRVLGASTLGKTGGEDMLSLVFTIGALSSVLGVRKYSYAASKK